VHTLATLDAAAIVFRTLRQKKRNSFCQVDQREKRSPNCVIFSMFTLRHPMKQCTSL
jgi:hypothetical protein